MYSYQPIAIVRLHGAVFLHAASYCFESRADAHALAFQHRRETDDKLAEALGHRRFKVDTKVRRIRE